jgi:hypothetical protein
VTALSSSFESALAGKFEVATELPDSMPSATSSRAALSSSSISLRRFCLSSSSRSRSLLLSFFVGVDAVPGMSSSSGRSEKARDLDAGGVQSSVVCTPLLYEKTSFTGDGGHS